ncbi:hypothetical protein GLOTRDRAFT_129586 [Gloeophyllum trabeum ATCC 11539]|uniref:Uncharacterized protein n=1 Tax=Gloeophyllum trabeum (strain ATCC 11539 / FP-39264 / Madison 617) TaxID=670483 RepID=S7RLM0_GLOTA|nr:uncharacterized protein GLOTRDRAFT_129586 [Gloeophyllum trabeum ATCC 11539]EPQ55305.1 hypothetical protein GLOTRDRAFT_129586 [Gloeophyllum trabeum ATCC 11539]
MEKKAVRTAPSPFIRSSKSYTRNSGGRPTPFPTFSKRLRASSHEEAGAGQVPALDDMSFHVFEEQYEGAEFQACWALFLGCCKPCSLSPAPAAIREHVEVANDDRGSGAGVARALCIRPVACGKGRWVLLTTRTPSLLSPSRSLG